MKNLTVSSIRELFPRANVRRYAKNQIICYQGDRPNLVFFVLSGHIKYYDIDENGNEKILHIVGPQNIFPMLYAFGVTLDVGAFYASIDAVEVITIPVAEFRQVTETNVKFSNELTRWFLTEIEQLVFRINSFEKTDSRLKIMHSLKYLALNYGHAESNWEKLNFPVTQQFLANFTGLTRETVSTTMNELQDEGVIQCNKGRLLEIKKTELKKIA